MLVQIVVIIQHVAFCLHTRVTSRTSCFLNVIFERIGDIVVDNELDVFLVNTHTESGRCNDRLDLISDERILIGDLFVCIHSAVEWLCRESVARKLFGKLNRASCP